MAGYHRWMELIKAATDFPRPLSPVNYSTWSRSKDAKADVMLISTPETFDTLPSLSPQRRAHTAGTSTATPLARSLAHSGNARFFPPGPDRTALHRNIPSRSNCNCTPLFSSFRWPRPTESVIHVHTHMPPLSLSPSPSPSPQAPDRPSFTQDSPSTNKKEGARSSSLLTLMPVAPSQAFPSTTLSTARPPPPINHLPRQPTFASLHHLTSPTHPMAHVTRTQMRLCHCHP